MLTELPPAALAVLAAAALLVGVAKTSVGGLASISVAVFALVLPARGSTGVLLPLLLVGDVFAVRAYRAHADWALMLRLLPPVFGGMLVGAVFVDRVDDVVMRRTIGTVLILLVLIHVLRRMRPSGPPATGLRAHGYAWSSGGLAGFTTMVANAGGAVMSLYLLSARMTMLGFLGTTAWFFFLVNLAKVPLSLGLGLMNPASLALDAVLVPFVLAGTVIGRRVIARIDQPSFERLVLAVTVLSSVPLVL